MALKADSARFVVAVDIDPTHRLSAVLGRTIVAEAGQSFITQLVGGLPQAVQTTGAPISDG